LQVIWIRDWPQEVLIQQAEYFINHLRVAENTSLKAREALAMAIANMHRWVHSRNAFVSFQCLKARKI